MTPDTAAELLPDVFVCFDQFRNPYVTTEINDDREWVKYTRPASGDIVLKRGDVVSLFAAFKKAYPFIAYDDNGKLVTTRLLLEATDGILKSIAILEAALKEKQ